MQHVNILWGQNAEFLDVKAGVYKATTMFEGVNIVVGRLLYVYKSLYVY